MRSARRSNRSARPAEFPTARKKGSAMSVFSFRNRRRLCTMLGAVLSLLLIGLMRFGMGLLNIQGQVQGMVIGLLLILSILLPNVVRSISASRGKINRQTVLAGMALAVVFGLFVAFFFWSRAPVLAGI